ncbi:hypothetical protein ACSBR1_026575 [Camellia fascicularis]
MFLEYESFLGPSFLYGHGTSYMDKLGFVSLTVWNMKTWKAITVLHLGEDPPAITSLCFNHNGKILAAAATDGMIHMSAIYVEAHQISFYFRYLNGACKSKVKFFGQEIAAGSAIAITLSIDMKWL